MTELMKLRICKDTQLSQLFACGVFSLKSESEFIVQKANTLDFNSYFNSIYPKFIFSSLGIRNLQISFYLKGSISLQLIHRAVDIPKTSLLEKKFTTKTGKKFSVNFTLEQKHSRGRIYLRVLAEKDTNIKDILVFTEDKPERKANTAIVVCTYNKQSYIDNLLEKFSKIEGQSFHVFIVDNARSYKAKIKGDFFTVIPNKNLGGSGGFTRGMIEAYSKKDFTHILLMDDDIRVETEIIRRTLAYMNFTPADTAFGGGMIDARSESSLWDNGAVWIPQKYRFRPLHNNINLSDKYKLDLMELEAEANYYGWWFFSFPLSFIDDVGFSLPFFIRGDDVEYSLRILEKGYKLQAFPGISIWHEPFYAKDPVWLFYYYIRNLTIVNELYFEVKLRDKLVFFIKSFLSSLFIFRYYSIEYLIEGIEDYLKGPEFIENLESDKFHSVLMKKSKERIEAYEWTDYSFKRLEEYTVSYSGIIKIFFSILTLNGHLFPFLQSKKSVSLSGLNKFRTISGSAEVLHINKDTGEMVAYRRKSLKGISLSFKFAFVLLKFIVKNSFVKRKYKKAHKKLTGLENWNKLLFDK